MTGNLDDIQIPEEEFESVEQMLSWCNATQADQDKKELYNQLLNKPLMTGNDLLRLPHEPNDYLIDNFLWKDDVAFIIGKEKACKSIFTSQEAMAMTCGDPFLETFDTVRQLKVLYVQAEGSIGETKDRIVRALTHQNIRWNADNWRHLYPPSLSLDTNEGFLEFQMRIMDDGFKPDVIILDPLYMSIEADLNDNKGVRAFLKNVRKLKETFGCSFIIVHHEHRKKKDNFGNDQNEGDDSIFGSSMLKNFASHILRISIVNENGKEIKYDSPDKRKYRKVVCTTSRSGKVNKKSMLILNEDTGIFDLMGSNSTSPIQQSVLQALKMHQPCSPKDLSAKTGIFYQTLSNSLQKLRARGLATNKGHGRGMWSSIEQKEELYEND